MLMNFKWSLESKNGMTENIGQGSGPTPTNFLKIFQKQTDG